ncbi:hypothetical protein [Polluticoccus soli]|uniref:hypothetical protein n=1 Tax=Polluticoccus soli TaxID=3034150 RepID=UPI0023E2FA09|nr:hypothetical protein [Flavipsychrobacter sp. JY13-12]
MKNYIIAAVAGLALMAAACKKEELGYDQYYRVEYSNKGYYSIATIKSGNESVRHGVSMNGVNGVWGGPGYVWHGDGHPDMQFAAPLHGKTLNNTVSYADAPLFDVYIPDTFSRAKGAWFLLDQANNQPGESKQFWEGGHGVNSLYASYTTPNDTVWVPIADNVYLKDEDSSYFQFGVFKEMELQQYDGNGKGHISLSKVYGKWVRLVP